MSRLIMLKLKNLRDVKRKRVIALAASAVLLIMLIILTCLNINVSDNNVTNANLQAMSSLSSSEEFITVNPHPYYNVKIAVDGMTYNVKSTGTVADALDAADVRVDRDDLLNVGLSEPLNSKTFIEVNRVDFKEEVSIETIDYATEYKDDDNYTIGYSAVVVDGEEGEIEKHIRHTFIDGKLADSTIVKTEITEPVDEVIVKGTSEINPIQAASISRLDVPADLVLDENGAPLSYSAVYTGKSCAYSAKPTAKTASGRTVMVGYVAVDPALIPYGTELYIASTDNKHIYGYAIAADTGTALLNGEILVDLFMGSYDESCQWGAKQVNIYVLN